MSMEFGNDNEIRSGSGGALMGLLAGSALNKDRDDGRGMTWFAMVIVLIVFFIAIIFLALAFKDRGYDRVGSNGNYGELLATMIAAKGMDGNCKNSDFDMLEIKQKLEHNEDRAETRRIQEEQNRQTQSFMQLGFGLSGQINAHEKTDLENFAKLEHQLGMQNMALTQLLQKENNRDVINGVIQQLTMGSPCFAKC